MNTDQNFPIIEYIPGKSHFEWGCQHGETFRSGIQEIAKVRTDLLKTWNPKMSSEKIENLANEQWDITVRWTPELKSEMEGICEGAGITLTEIVVLNNYTDFRDIQIPDQGCSTVFVEYNKDILAGQTWDMHGSAKNYVCVIKIPQTKTEPAALVYSLVGSLGLMGFNSQGAMVGVNNLTSNNAKSGIIWPALIRKGLSKSNQTKMRQLFLDAPVTSGHNYLLADTKKAEMLEITPGIKEVASEHVTGNDAYLFHTNHCLTEKAKATENNMAKSSTSLKRYELISQRITSVKSTSDMYSMLTSHDNYPMSICSHYDSGRKDPSLTCGGAIGDLRKSTYTFWRGCPHEDKNFVKYDFKLAEGGFV